MNAQESDLTGEEIVALFHGHIRGDVSVLDEDREKVARDTSIFYLKPKVVIYPQDKEDISKILLLLTQKKREGFDPSIAMRAAGTCMTGGPLSEWIVLDTTRYMNHVTEVTDIYAVTEPGVYYRDFEKETLQHGWIMPSYPASRELAAIGGIVSNNSGGEKTLTYGKTERYVRSVDVVYANGEYGTVQSLTKEELEKVAEGTTENSRIHKEMHELITNNYELIMKAKPSVSKNSSGYYLWNVYDKEKETFDFFISQSRF